jgi:heme exporter protein C
MSTATKPALTDRQLAASAQKVAPVAAPIHYAVGRTRILNGLGAISTILMLLSIGMALFYAGTDSVQGNVQRVFYMHLGAFGAATVAFTVTVIGGIAYLITRNARWDKLALAGVQIGLPLATVTLITGAIWARPTWNTWWERDPRLDAMLVMWVIYAAYLTLRTTIASQDRKARFAAVYGILAFVSVIYTTIVSRTRTDTLHPVVIAPQLSTTNEASVGAFPVSNDVIVTISVSSISWMVLCLTLIWYRVRQENLYERVQELKARVLAQD